MDSPDRPVKPTDPGADHTTVIEPVGANPGLNPYVQPRRDNAMLARIHKAMEEKDEGFTLIELLVVMIIIGILAAIAIPVFMSQKKKAYETSLKADLHQIATNIETAMTDNPATVAVAAGAASANGNNTVTITPSTGSAITVGLSSDNSFVALTGNGTGNTIDSNDGVYCVELEHGTSASAPHWKIVSDGTSQTVQSGTC